MVRWLIDQYQSEDGQRTRGKGQVARGKGEVQFKHQINQQRIQIR